MPASGSSASTYCYTQHHNTQPACTQDLVRYITKKRETAGPTGEEQPPIGRAQVEAHGSRTDTPSNETVRQHTSNISFTDLNLIFIRRNVLHQLSGHALHMSVSEVELIPRQQAALRGGIGAPLHLHALGTLLVECKGVRGVLVQVECLPLGTLCCKFAHISRTMISVGAQLRIRVPKRRVEETATKQRNARK